MVNARPEVHLTLKFSKFPNANIFKEGADEFVPLVYLFLVHMLEVITGEETRGIYRHMFVCSDVPEIRHVEADSINRICSTHAFV